MAKVKGSGKELDLLLQGQDSGFSGTREEWEKTIKDLTASECVGSLKLIHILHRTLLMQLKKRIELEKPCEVDNGVSTSAFSLAEASDSPELQR